MRTALTVFTIAATLLSCVQKASADIPWHENLRNAHSQAQAQGKLLLLHFYSDNCVWCDRLEAGSFQDPTVAAAISKGYVPVKVHAGKNPKLTEMFKVSKYPTDVIVSTDGKTLLHKVSPQQPDRYVAMLAGAASIAPTVAAKRTQPAVQVAAAPKSPAPQVASQPKAQPASVPSYAKSAPAPQVTPPAAPAPETKVAAVSTPAPSGVMTLPNGPSQPTAKTSQFALPTGKLSGGTPAKAAAARSESLSLSLPDNLAAPAAEVEIPEVKIPQVTVPQVKIPQVNVAVEAPKPAAKSPEKKPQPGSQPELAMQGFCPVTVINEDRWVEGNPKLGVVHLGKLYLFSDVQKMQTFLADPVPYTPVLNEIDVVRFFEERVIVQGKREWGLKDPTYNRMFFFADEAAMNHFWNEYERYTGAAIEVMEKAIKDANPGT